MSDAPDKYPQSILVIESDPVLCDLIQLSLEQQDNKVAVAHNGEEAHTVYKRQKPKIILLDLFLHQTNALELIRQLKRLASEEEIYIIVLSAFGYREVIEQAMEAGAKDFLLKPINTDVLLDRVKKAFEQLNSSGTKKPRISKPDFPRIY